MWTKNINVLKAECLENDRTFLPEFSSGTNPKGSSSDNCVFKFLRRSVDGKYLMPFQSENTVYFSDVVWTGSQSSGVTLAFIQRLIRLITVFTLAGVRPRFVSACCGLIIALVFSFFTLIDI